MGEKLSINERLALGDEAERLLKDGSMFNGVVNMVTKDYITQLMMTSPGSPAGLSAHAGLNALNNIKEAFRVIANDGAVARNEIKKQEKQND